MQRCALLAFNVQSPTVVVVSLVTYPLHSYSVIVGSNGLTLQRAFETLDEVLLIRCGGVRTDTNCTLRVCAISFPGPAVTVHRGYYLLGSTVRYKYTYSSEQQCLVKTILGKSRSYYWYTGDCCSI